jgi:hypothetical protein
MTDDDRLYDPLRRKWVARTPEEEVRQRVIAWLRDVQGFPVGLMESEYGFTYNRRRYRADILAFDRQLQPWLLVECKAPDVPLGAAVVEQVVRYTRVLPVQYVMVTNGNTTHLLVRSDDGASYEALTAMPDSLR